jgi:malate dehydrogenase (oxaloacetate-decarboxylating)(NADP+)
MIDNMQGQALLNDPVRNKGTAFTLEERGKYGLDGLLPHAVESLDRQLERVMQHLDAKPNDLERYVYLIGLADRNETLFYRTLMSDPARFVPIVYDPTVADACLAFGHVYRRARGMYITREMKGRIAEVLRNWRPHSRSRRHRRQRHGYPDWQVAALYRLRGSAA